MNDIQLIGRDTYPLESAPVSKLNFVSFLSEDEKQFCRNFKEYEDIRPPDTPYISSTYNLFENIELYNLKHKFYSAIRIYVEQVLHAPSLNFKLTGSWLTKNTNNTSHHSHKHPNTMLSMVTYFDDSVGNDKELPGIMFLSEKLSKVFPTFQFDFKDVETTEWNLFNYETYTIRPKQNEVIVFPGHLRHSSEACFTGSRYCIGANYFFTGEIGKDFRKNTIIV
jgi:hypothetical protein